MSSRGRPIVGIVGDSNEFLCAIPLAESLRMGDIHRQTHGVEIVKRIYLWGTAQLS